MVFFGNMYIVPSYGYGVFLLLSTCMSMSNFLWLYLLNVQPEWPVSTYVTLKSRNDIMSKIEQCQRALSVISPNNLTLSP